MHLFFILLLVIITSSCYNNNGEELLAAVNTNCNSETATFKATVLPILDKSCNSCHNQAAPRGISAGIILDNHTDVLKYTTGRNSLFGSINHSSGFSPMPKNSSKIDDCSIKKVDSWIKNGAKND